NSIGTCWSALSIVSDTSARPRAERLSGPGTMTSSIFWDRTELGACAPSAQPTASTTLDLPDPLGPTTTVTPGSRSSTVVSANDLKPFRVNVLRCTPTPRGPDPAPPHRRGVDHQRTMAREDTTGLQ